MKFKFILDKNNNKISYIYDNIKNRLFYENSIVVPKNFPASLLEFNNDDDCHVKLNLGKLCNFKCKYCSQVNSRKNENLDKFKLSDENIYKLIDKLFEYAPRYRFREVSVINFWGGEPLLHYDTIIKIIHYIDEKYPNKIKSYGIITNGSLFDEKWYNLCIDKNIDVTLSHDALGQEYRGEDPLKDNSNSKIWLQKYCKAKGKIKINPCFTNKNKTFEECETFFNSIFGIGNFDISEGRFPSVFDDNGLSVLPTTKEFEEIKIKNLKALVSGKLYSETFILKMAVEWLDSLSKKPSEHRWCSTVGNIKMLSVDVLGNIMVCQNFNADEKDEFGESYKIGNIFNNDQYIMPKEIGLEKRIENRCQYCEYKHICGGMCPYVPSKYDDINCEAAKALLFDILGVALYQISGAILTSIEKIKE
jgi:radical SAM protein with 4Fe4S-binding SPASM domain